jgi:pimeloyl-ACP methyl ester carboxylesterase
MRGNPPVRGPEWSTTELVEGHRVGVTVAGAGTGAPMLLLHGIGRDRRDWSEVLPAFAVDRRVIAIDLEGFGESEPWSDQVTLATMTWVVRRTLIALGVEVPVVVVANSMGGAVALRLHADDPGAVSVLVLASPAGFAADAALGLRLMGVPGLGPLLLKFSPIAARVQVRSLFADRAFATRLLIAEAVERIRRREQRRVYFQVVRDLGSWRGVRAEWRAEVLRSLAAAGTPTLVLWGERDAVLPVEQLTAAALALPHARTRILQGVGHVPQIENPGGFVDEVASFLDEEGVR